MKWSSLRLVIFCCVYACTWKRALSGLKHAIYHCQLLSPFSFPTALIDFIFLLSVLYPCRSRSPSPLCFSQVRKFVSKDSAGLRVRSHPSLQSEQIGIVHVNGTITFIDEVIDFRPGRRPSYSMWNTRVHFCPVSVFLLVWINKSRLIIIVKSRGFFSRLK